MSHLYLDTGARLGASLFGELRNAVFARVAQASQRRVALATFEHLHALGHSFHVTKANAGVLSRTIDRGLKYNHRDVSIHIHAVR
jgi:ABC-type transport system involved in Fe-S cluster assembly fused permease/ATPase subunit